MSSARDAGPGAHQKEKKSVLAVYIIANRLIVYMTVTLRVPYEQPLIPLFRVSKHKMTAGEKALPAVIGLKWFIYS